MLAVAGDGIRKAVEAGKSGKVLASASGGGPS